MAVIVRAYSETDGQIAYASSVNRIVDDLYTLQGGNINSANLAASGVGAGNLETSSVITRTLNGGAVTADKVDGEMKFYGEVFG
jgi:hypothetical protein